MNKDTIFTLKEYDKAYQWCLENEDYTIEQIDGTKNYRFIVKEEVSNRDLYLTEQRKFEIKQRLDKLSQDFIQILCGAVIENEQEKIQEFRTLHNELREFEGKEPRVYDGGEENAIQ